MTICVQICGSLPTASRLPPPLFLATRCAPTDSRYNVHQLLSVWGTGRLPAGTLLLLGLLLITAFLMRDDDSRSVCADLLSATCRPPVLLLPAAAYCLQHTQIWHVRCKLLTMHLSQGTGGPPAGHARPSWTALFTACLMWDDDPHADLRSATHC
jgi:hypothetical protein